MEHTHSTFENKKLKKSNTFCNNCGNTGHSYNKCKEPITSVGIIGYYYDKDIEEVKFLLIRRKDSVGYVDFLRGKYDILNKQYLSNIIDEMTIDEKLELMYTEFDTLWCNLWDKEYEDIKFKHEERISKGKFKALKRGIDLKHSSYTLNSLINASSTLWTEPEWEFPKGRRNYNENDFTTGLREFEEETGISRGNVDIIQNVIPFEEIFTGSNFKSYKNKYFLARVNPDVSLQDYQTSEVSDIGWYTYEEALSKFREYNHEKKDILKDIQQLIHKYLL